ncbi:tetratricopeptide repeat protein [Streptomyces sp. NBC_01803]|uniref:tetratricopeptide repeat protein n=1 Tax=Streptomyces sp. NBC_01803 TaxID=2975946 RepID=UPI002DD8308E|nr:tetratricopeptide repeat protein [Streptomyces sp. NBC_01803]WSA44356.1 tetratricopeptide repeat protein [Streptomyces sp. NBC_01803]
MATSSSASRPDGHPQVFNHVFRQLRGPMSQGEFAAAVRRAAREIGERVSCDARYIGRVEAGEIRCPNYAYERVFLHMFPGHTLTDLGFEARQVVRRRRPPHGVRTGPGPSPRPPSARSGGPTGTCAGTTGLTGEAGHPDRTDATDTTEEGDVLRRAFMTGGPTAVASLTALGSLPASAGPSRPGGTEAAALTRAVRDIRLLDDRHGADALYRPACDTLQAAFAMLDSGALRQRVSDQLHSAAGELAISVGWLAHDSGRLTEARSHYAEALATARISGDAALEAHAFCNTAFLARDTGHHREAVRAAQAGRQAALRLGSDELLALLALREASGWAGLGDRPGTREALGRARAHHERGRSDADPEWMSFFGDAEFAGQEAGCWAMLGDWERASGCQRRAVTAAGTEPHFARNITLYAAELAQYLVAHDEPEEAAVFGNRALDLLDQVRSTRIASLLDHTARRLRPASGDATVASFLDRRRARRAPALPVLPTLSVRSLSA